MADIGRALAGLGAAFKNEVPQFQQQMRQEDLYQMKLEDRDRALDDRMMAQEEKRKETLFRDTAVAKQYLEEGDLDSISELFRDRVNLLERNGVNTRNSQSILQLADQARAGNQDAMGALTNEINQTYSTGQLFGVIPKPPKPDYTTVAKGAVVLNADGSVRYDNTAPVVAKDRRTFEDGRGIRRYEDTGLPVFGNGSTSGGSDRATPAPDSTISPMIARPASQVETIDPYANLNPLDARALRQEDDDAEEERKRKQKQFEFEEAAERRLVTSETEDEENKIRQGRTAFMILNELKNNPEGLSGAVGGFSSRMPSFSDETIDFEAKYKYVKDLLTLDNLSLMKGVLTDRDIELLANAASGLQLRMSEDAFNQQLDTLIQEFGATLTKAGIDISEISRPTVQSYRSDPSIGSKLSAFDQIVNTNQTDDEAIANNLFDK